MSFHWLRWRSCTSKVQYPRRSDAANAARRMPKKRGHRARAYRCEFGDHWHVGHSRKVHPDRRR